ncbi:MAG: MFS transporter [Planctomycetaceae bacterium]|nr:MFS transporter [Planctomycetales bacterium]MCB9920835.1 MFS transporter [Planctomycetaceae bacterium]
MLAIYQIVMRTGWIFKTESIIMPAVVDYISGAGWIRGCLPLLNRFGHSVPPVLLARQVKLQPQKKWMVFGTTALMSGLFLLLTWLFFMGFAARKAAWMPIAFLIIYAAFFTCIGLNQLAFTTLQGKLVEANRRGRLLLVSNTVGAVSAVLCAFLLLSQWLSEEGARYDLIFGFSGILFGGSAVAMLFVIESKDSFQQEAAAHPIHYFADAYRVLAADHNFRMLATVASLFGVSFMLFPHYQSLGLQTMKLPTKSLMWWVIIQNLGTGLVSVPIGGLADRHGNRLVLRFALLGIAAAPLLAIGLLHSGTLGIRLYSSVFVLVGMTPVVLRTLQNYTLEIAEPEHHAVYLSTLSLCMAGPMFLSPLAGYFIDRVGFEAVFLTIAGLISASWLLTFRLHEPRHNSD